MGRPPTHFVGERIGTRTLTSTIGNGRWMYRCDCGREGGPVTASDLAKPCVSCMPRELKRTPLHVGFWEKVNKNGPTMPHMPTPCWEWTGHRLPFGHGQLGRYRRSDGKQDNYYAHRVSYEMTNGPIPEGLEVRHRCDNPPCVRPDHLQPGTHAENMRDMSVRGRFNIGPANAATREKRARQRGRA